MVTIITHDSKTDVPFNVGDKVYYINWKNEFDRAPEIAIFKIGSITVLKDGYQLNGSFQSMVRKYTNWGLYIKPEDFKNRLAFRTFEEAFTAIMVDCYKFNGKVTKAEGVTP